MNKWRAISIVAFLGVAGAAVAQQRATPHTPLNEANEASPSAPATAPQGATSGKVVPGQTPTQGAPNDAQAPTSSSGTAADGTAARETPAAEPGVSSGTAAAKIVGRAVVTPTDAPLGKVSEVVFDSQGQPAFVVISAAGKNSALPYATASSMLSGEKVVIDKTRLQGAPKLKTGEWRDKSSTGWKNDSIHYWERS